MQLTYSSRLQRAHLAGLSLQFSQKKISLEKMIITTSSGTGIILRVTSGTGTILRVTDDCILGNSYTGFRICVNLV